MSKINRLTPRGHWEDLYDRQLQSERPEDDSFRNKLNSFLKTTRNKLNSFLKTTLREDVYQKITEPYSGYLFWQICKQYLPKKNGLKMLEIGSAPGDQLVQFKRIFGYDPYGVEYSESGATLNRHVFALNDISPDQVIYSDFFSKDFQEQYCSYFDIVLSRGFIEHFAEPKTYQDAFQLIKKRRHLRSHNPEYKWGQLFSTIYLG